MAAILNDPVAQAMIRAAGDDPTKRAEALEQIIVQHEAKEKLDAAIRSALRYQKIVTAVVTAAGLSAAVWRLRRF
jgi:O-methyltransferase involved in polyketide biosynthesis